MPKWLENLFSGGVIASFIYSETVDIGTDDHDIAINNGLAYAIHVGTAGDIKLVNPDGKDQVYPNVQPGVHAFACTKIYRTGTEATGIVAGAW